MSRSKKNKAVALKYNVQEDMAPIVIASGYGEVAQRIIDTAERQGIPVFRDDSAASMLCMLEVGSLCAAAAGVLPDKERARPLGRNG